jgi:predicted kinase
MANCYVLCGIPASGKSTLAHQIAEQHNAIVHSYDDIPNAWGNRDADGSFYRQWMDNIKNDLRSGNSVVCDSTALTSINRKNILSELSGIDCEKVLIVKAVPIEVCVQRNKGRFREVPEYQIELSARLLEAPTKDEGWDKILVYRD